MNLVINPNEVLALTNRISRELLTRSKQPHEVRAPLAHSDVLSGGAQPNALVGWHDMYTKPFLDELVIKELDGVYFTPVRPGGRTFRRLTFPGTMMQAVGASSTPSAATPVGTTLTPVTMHAYTQIGEDAMLDLINDVQMIMGGPNTPLADTKAMVDQTVNLAFIYASLRSGLNLAINGDVGGGGTGLNLFNGWLHQLTNNAHGTTMTYSISGSAYLATIFPEMWSKFMTSGDPAHLMQSDAAIYCSLKVLSLYRQQVRANTLDIRGFYDPKTGETMFDTAHVYGMRDWPDAKIVLTRKSNMVLGVINQLLNIRQDFQLNGAYHEMSCPFHSHAVVVDCAAAVLGA